MDYFDTKVFLAQSPQFYKQAMVASGLERVFEIGCAYRAEKHETPRHLNEYVSLDVEMAWIESEKDLMDLEVRILKSIFRGLERDCAAELSLWKATVPTDAEVERIPRVSHDQAREMLLLDTPGGQPRTPGCTGSEACKRSFFHPGGASRTTCGGRRSAELRAAPVGRTGGARST